jgi:hypothetical protein
MADAINAKSDVLGERELDAVSGGMSVAPFVRLVDQFIQAAGGGTSGGGQDPAAQQFQQLLQQLTHG